LKTNKTTFGIWKYKTPSFSYSSWWAAKRDVKECKEQR
jgi:hypothetical protein